MKTILTIIAVLLAFALCYFYQGHIYKLEEAIEISYPNQPRPTPVPTINPNINYSPIK